MTADRNVMENPPEAHVAVITPSSGATFAGQLPFVGSKAGLQTTAYCNICTSTYDLRQNLTFATRRLVNGSGPPAHGPIRIASHNVVGAGVESVKPISLVK